MNELRIDSPKWSDLHFSYIIDLDYLLKERRLTSFKNFIRKVVKVADDPNVNALISESLLNLMNETKDTDKKLHSLLVKKYEFLQKVGVAYDSGNG